MPARECVQVPLLMEHAATSVQIVKRAPQLCLTGRPLSSIHRISIFPRLADSASAHRIDASNTRHIPASCCEDSCRIQSPELDEMLVKTEPCLTAIFAYLSSELKTFIYLRSVPVGLAVSLPLLSLIPRCFALSEVPVEDPVITSTVISTI